MAIYHLSAKIITRSSGRTATASAAYRAGAKILDRQSGKLFDYSRKRSVGFCNIYAPDKSPMWVRDRETLWNEVERAETRKDGQVAREIVVALPVELPEYQRIKLIERFVMAEFVSKGMVADVCLHNSAKNPHAHIMLTTRSINSAGFGQKNRDWNSKELLQKWREQWAVRTNNRLAVSGSKAHIDHRSLKQQGLNRNPTRHIGNVNRRDSWTNARKCNINKPYINTEEIEMDGLKKLATNVGGGEDALPPSGRYQPMSAFMPLNADAYVKKTYCRKLLDREYEEWLGKLFYGYSMSIERAETDIGICLRIDLPLGIVFDYGSQLQCENGTDEEIEIIVRLAKEKGWAGLHLQGSEEFKKRVFVRAMKIGAFCPEQIGGYLPSEELIDSLGLELKPRRVVESHKSEIRALEENMKKIRFNI